MLLQNSIFYTYRRRKSPKNDVHDKNLFVRDHNSPNKLQIIYNFWYTFGEQVFLTTLFILSEKEIKKEILDFRNVLQR